MTEESDTYYDLCVKYSDEWGKPPVTDKLRLLAIRIEQELAHLSPRARLSLFELLVHKDQKMLGLHCTTLHSNNAALMKERKKARRIAVEHRRRIRRITS